MSKLIRYFVGFDCRECYNENRDVSTAAMTKAEYIQSVLVSLGYKVEIVSNATSKNKKGFYHSHRYFLNENVSLAITPSLGNGNKVFRRLNLIISNAWLLFYGLLNLGYKETIIVYHGINKIPVLLLLKRIKKINIILEVEEIYGNVGALNARLKSFEEKMIRAADKYIVITEELNSLINKEKKDYCVLNGTYKYVDHLSEKKKDGLVKVVYAGTFNEEKGGAFKAIEMAKYLPDNYKVYILGFGTEEEIHAVKQSIDNANEQDREKLVYAGLKRDQEFLEFLGQCDIGLSTQNGTGKYNATSFPSKILTYMCCGLEVVSVKIPVVYNSQVGKYVHYYNDDNPSSIAQAVQKVTVKPADKKMLMEKLSLQFSDNLQRLINIQKR